jgi:methyl-accepting chemotaxis protein
VMRSLEQIETEVQRVAAVTAEISAAVEHQATVVTEIDAEVEQMNVVTQEVAASAEESASAAAELESQARTLRDTVAQFRLKRGPARAAARSATGGTERRSTPRSEAPWETASDDWANMPVGAAAGDDSDWASTF